MSSLIDPVLLQDGTQTKLTWYESVIVTSISCVAHSCGASTSRLAPGVWGWNAGEMGLGFTLPGVAGFAYPAGEGESTYGE